MYILFVDNTYMTFGNILYCIYYSLYETCISTNKLTK